MTTDQGPPEEQVDIDDQPDRSGETVDKGTFHPPVEGLVTGDGGEGEG